MSDFTLPTSRPITQEWAQDFSWLNGVFYPNGFYSSLGWKGHNGIDYGCFVGDEVEAVCDGVIEYVGPGNNHPLLSGGGNVILLRSDKYQMRFEYLHLSQQNVYTTQRVTKGQVIGLSGNSGVSTAQHLHLGAIPVGNVNQNDGWRGRVDPTPYLYGSLASQGTITSTSTTPFEEDDPLAGFSREELVQIAAEGTLQGLQTQGQFQGGRNAIDHLNQMRTELGNTRSAVDGVPQKILFDTKVEGRNLFDSIKQVRTDVFGTRGGTAIDIPALAKELASQLEAKDVAALAAQLQITVKES